MLDSVVGVGSSRLRNLLRGDHPTGGSGSRVNIGINSENLAEYISGDTICAIEG